MRFDASPEILNFNPNALERWVEGARDAPHFMPKHLSFTNSVQGKLLHRTIVISNVKANV